MARHTLRLHEDRFVTGGVSDLLSPLNRVLYVLSGEITVSSGGKASRIRANAGWFGAGECTLTAGRGGATALRYEVVADGDDTVESTLGAFVKQLCEHPVELAPTESYLMRCDRVDFDLGGVAPPHRHQGGGIRCLIAGSMELRIEGHPTRTIAPGQAWFESGREPVYAAASRDTPTSFIRVSILPRAIKGQSSIMYIDPEDARRSRPRTYTVFVDEPIKLS
jgi:quercetin dioxygenase-like cupin family protein